MEIRSLLNFYLYTSASWELKLGFIPEKAIKILSGNMKRRRYFFLKGHYLIRNRYGLFVVTQETMMLSLHKEQALEPYFSQLDREDVMIDIGAHTGKWTVFSLNHSNVARIYAIEPIYDYYQLLHANLVLNSRPGRFMVANSVLSSFDGKIRMAKDGASSHISQEGEREVESEKLDTFCYQNSINPADIGLIKIDVEGHELEVLEGMRGTLQNMNGDIIIELLTERRFYECSALLAKYGYELHERATHNDYVFRKR